MGSKTTETTLSQPLAFYQRPLRGERCIVARATRDSHRPLARRIVTFFYRLSSSQRRHLSSTLSLPERVG